MDKFKIETAQNITIQQNVAHVTTRIGAFFIDFLVQIFYVITVMVLLNALDFKFNMDYILFYMVLMLPIFLYSLIFETLMNGQTLGKYLTAIRVTKLDGSKPTFGSYLIRWVLRIIDISLASGSVALLTILLNGKGQRLGDLAAGTTVISEKKSVKISDTFATELPADYKPSYPQVTMLTDNDIQTIKELYTKAMRTNNHKTILKLNTKILSITNIKTELDAINFIDKVIKDYNYYTQRM
ncbi:MAG TPA: RDD family protein [Flavobacteriaceae bacterium]|nr:RDD family protein [Flavobacteriaceae bacterium]